ncbi:hypothetical protein SH1V18_03540 [Vallitalea longa]|uniref:Uncharacterized protein n=1 Tax=Vallitalea longa TaxID=2936439 RepID=A0A9W6DES0_9FIRM|nr:hypothetical protein [Vallitalea longa]GKX27874.1 hypothetical protein SH1V18_03540 [Vallitalea longa]
MKNYMEIDFSKVKGYNKLGPNAKEIFVNTYKTHNSSIGKEYKKDWVPVEVTIKNGKLVVTFCNGEWLHYYKDYTWG